jgi:hypothetical protein
MSNGKEQVLQAAGGRGEIEVVYLCGKTDN